MRYLLSGGTFTSHEKRCITCNERRQTTSNLRLPIFSFRLIKYDYATKRRIISY